MTSMRAISAFRVMAMSAVLLLTFAVAACSSDTDGHPTTTTGSPDNGGTAVSTNPALPPDFHVVDATPTSQQQAQDAVIGYLTKTLKELPPGTVFDNSRYPGSGNTPCTDQPTGTPPNEYADKRQAIFPPGTNVEAMIAKAGQIWTSWGWHVMERDGFRKPNQFGYGPDGYALQIVASNPPGYPPTITGVSPCYPGELASANVPVPAVLGNQ